MLQQSVHCTALDEMPWAPQSQSQVVAARFALRGPPELFLEGGAGELEADESEARTRIACLLRNCSTSRWSSPYCCIIDGGVIAA